MGHVPVPWFVGGDAITPDKIARLVSYVAAGGREGVLNALDCRVLALQTPGPAIRVTPGAYTINNRTAPNENYSGMVESDDVVGTTATGSSGGRSDLVVIIVKDPNNTQEGWDEPADPANGPYISTEIITGVPAGTTTWAQLGRLGSAIALARIDIPANTATITQAMIKNLRSTTDGQANGGGTSGTVTPDPVAGSPTPQSAAFIDSVNCTSDSTLNAPAANQTGPWTFWPSEGSWNVSVPSWATEVAIYVIINPRISNSVFGRWRLMFNNRPSQDSLFDVNFPGAVQANNPLRTLYVLGGKLTIPAAERGKVVPVKTQAYTLNSGGGTPGNSKADAGTVLYCSLAFRQGASLS